MVGREGLKDETDETIELPPTPLTDRFEVTERIGAGGMAEVFRALDKESGARVALKVPRSRDREDWARFAREAAMLVELDHEGIVKHTAEGRAADGTPFLAMEWLEGEDLATRLARGPLTVDETLAVGMRIAGALGAANAAGVVHRDVKPSNIFLRGGAVEGATLIDFGIARRLVSPVPTTSLTRTGVLLGTLGYMAPEQALGAKTADARADVFSLGCVLFECLTGTRAFAGAHAVEVLAKILTYDVPPPSTLAPDAPPALDALVRRMLARDPAVRPANGSVVGAELRRIRDGATGARDVRPRAAIAGLAVGALVGTAVVALALGRSRARVPPPAAAPVWVAPALSQTSAGAGDDARTEAKGATPVASPRGATTTAPRSSGATRARPRPKVVGAPATPPSTVVAEPAPPPPRASADPFGSSRN